MSDYRREYRFDVEIQGRYRTGSGVARDVVVNDLSTSGCKFFDRFSNITIGTALSIKVGSIGPLSARVRWIEGQTVGVEFESRLHQSVLDHMRTTMQGWAPQTAQPRAASPESLPRTAPIGEPEKKSQQTLRIRKVDVDDLRSALTARHLALPLRTEDEVLALFTQLIETLRTR